jgi:hypothetical protein
MVRVPVSVDQSDRLDAPILDPLEQPTGLLRLIERVDDNRMFLAGQNRGIYAGARTVKPSDLPNPFGDLFLGVWLVRHRFDRGLVEIVCRGKESPWDWERFSG